MSEFGVVFKYYLKKEVKSKTYIIVTAIMMIASFLSFFIVSEMGDKTDKKAVYVIDKTDYISEILKSSDLADGVLANISLNYSKANSNLSESKMKQSAKEDKKSYVILEEKDSLIHIKAIDAGNVNSTYFESLKSVIAQVVQDYNITELDISADVVNKVSPNISMEIIDPSTKTDNFMITYILYMVMVIVIVMYSVSAATEIGYLKTNKVMEILTTSIKPIPLYIGTTAAIGLSGLIQLVLVLIAGTISYNLNNLTILESMGIHITSACKWGLVFYIILFILGFVLYSLLNTSSASIVNHNDDLTMALLPIEFIAMVQFFICIGTLEGDGIVSVICSYLPFTSPSVMFVRYMMGYVHACNVVIAIVLLVIADIIVTIVGAKLFTRGVVHYGTMKEFGKKAKDR